MKIRQAIGVAVAVASAVVGGSIGAQTLQQANTAPLAALSHLANTGSARGGDKGQLR